MRSDVEGNKVDWTLWTQDNGDWTRAYKLMVRPGVYEGAEILLRETFYDTDNQ